MGKFPERLGSTTYVVVYPRLISGYFIGLLSQWVEQNTDIAQKNELKREHDFTRYVSSAIDTSNHRLASFCIIILFISYHNYPDVLLLPIQF
jgi:hypothetical protein